MADSISISHNINLVARDFQRKLTKSNILFGISKTLTDLAKMGSQEVKKDLPKYFTVRRQWIVLGIRFSPSSKTSLQAAVYSVDSGGRRDFMALQEFGGIKSPQTANHVAIPLQAVKPTPQSIVPQGMKPKNLLRYGPSKGARQEGMKQRAQAFKIKGKRAGYEWIMIRKGGKVVPAWLLVPKSQIKPTHFLRDPTIRIVNKYAAETLRKNLAASLK